MVKPAGGQLLEPSIDLAADIEDDVLLEAVVEPDAQGIESVAQGERRQKAEDGLPQKIPPPGGDHIVHHEAGQLRIGEGCQLAEQRAQNGARGQQGVRPEVAGDAADNFSGGSGTDGKGSLCVAVDMGEVLHNDWMRTDGLANWLARELSRFRGRPSGPPKNRRPSGTGRAHDARASTAASPVHERWLPARRIAPPDGLRRGFPTGLESALQDAVL